MSDRPRAEVSLRAVLNGLVLSLPLWTLLGAAFWTVYRLVDWAAMPIAYAVPVAVVFAIAAAGIVAWTED